MKKTYKYRIHANQKTLANAEQWLWLCRRLYNAALEQRITAYKRGRHTLSAYDQSNELPDLKAAFPEYKDVGSQVLQGVLERLNLAYRAFFRRVKAGHGKAGFPRFKGRNRYDSFTLKQSCWKLDGRYLTIRNVGTFKLRLSRAIEGTIKTVTIRRSPTGKWYACFSCDNVPERRLPVSDKAIGIDVGLKSFLVDSDGGKVEAPKVLREAEAVLRCRQRRLARRVKGSNRRGKARVLVAKAHETVSNRRNDFLHKTANSYIANYGLIAIEDLKISNMVHNRHLNKSIVDASWGRFFDYLSFKAEDAGRIVVKVNPHNTSQNCSGCGEKVPKALSVRTHACPHCGLVLDRDENAAINIKAAGQAVQELTYASRQSVS